MRRSIKIQSSAGHSLRAMNRSPDNETMNAAICAAIKKKAVIQFNYKGSLRIVEPQCHGTSTAGNEVLRGFQTKIIVTSVNLLAISCLKFLKFQVLSKPVRRFRSPDRTIIPMIKLCATSIAICKFGLILCTDHVTYQRNVISLELTGAPPLPLSF
jgi:hypothetical protein